MKTRKVIRKAGAFLTRGADTCVYSPAVMCSDGRDDSANPNVISRIVSSNSTDDVIEDSVKRHIDVVTAVLSGTALREFDIRKHFTVNSYSCTPQFRPEDMKPNNAGRECVLHDVMLGVDRKTKNLVTPKYVSDLDKYYKEQAKGKPNEALIIETLTKLVFELCFACMLLTYNNEIVLHLDSHTGNIAVAMLPNGNNALTLSDWGRSLIVDYTAPDAHARLLAAARADPNYRDRMSPHGNLDRLLINDWGPGFNQFRYIVQVWDRCLRQNDQTIWTKAYMCTNVLGILGGVSSILTLGVTDPIANEIQGVILSDRDRDINAVRSRVVEILIRYLDPGYITQAANIVKPSSLGGHLGGTNRKTRRKKTTRTSQRRRR